MTDEPLKPWASDDEREMMADLCRRSLWHFVNYAYGLQFWQTEKKIIIPRIHKPICNWLQMHMLEWLKTRKRKDLMLLIPRDFGKSTIVTKAAHIWLHLQDSEVSSYIGSESSMQAWEFLDSIRSIFDGSDPYQRFTWLYGSYYDSKRLWTRGAIVHAARKGVGRTEPSIGTHGVEKTITGKHPDVWFLDDPISYEALAAHTSWFLQVNDLVDSVTPVFGNNALIIWPGTRYGDGDHFGKALRSEGAASITGMPLPYARDGGVDILRENGRWHVYFLAARDADNKAIFPERIDDEFLDNFERRNNLRYFAQYMNDPGKSEFNPLLREDIERLWLGDEKPPKTLRCVVTIDTAFKSNERQARGDESVMIMWGISRDGDGKVYYLEGKGSNVWRMDDFLKELVELVRRWRQRGYHIGTITDESEMAGKTGTWEFALRTFFNAAKVDMPELKQLNRTANKKLGRIVQAASYWKDGYVRFSREAPGINRLIDQMVKIGSSANDDWADAGADIFNSAVYTPPFRGLKHVSRDKTEGALPGDDYLKQPKGLTIEQMLEEYDRFYPSEAEDEWAPPPPI